MRSLAAANCDIGTNGVDVNESSTRWIIGSTATALGVTTALTAAVGITLHWYLAIWLVTALAGCWALVIVADAKARARETERRAAGRAALDEGVQAILGAIGEHAERMEMMTKQHAARMEAATARHGRKLRVDVFNAERVLATKWRGQTLAQYDAAMEAARRSGNDTGPLPIISGDPR